MKKIFLAVKNFIISHKLISVVVGVVLVLGIAGGIIGCNLCRRASVEENDIQQTAEETTTQPTHTETPKETESESATETETETVDTGFVNPLTGEMTETDISQNRPYALMLNTIAQALPQRGNSKADVLIEMTEEGGITRVMGLYQDITGVGELGSIRSTREYYLSWVMGFDGILVHAGGDSWVLKQIKNSGYANLNFIYGYGNNAEFAFYRDQDRVASVGSEHALFTTSERLQDASKQLNVQTTHTTEDYTHFLFAEDGDGTPDDGEAATSVKVTFSGYKYTSFQFNEETGLYDVFFWEDPYVDQANNNQQVSVSNIIVLPVPNWTDTDKYKKVRQKYNLAGGDGYYICGGKYIPIKWSKGDFNEDKSQYGNAFNMTTVDGEPIELSKGKTYICCMADYNPVEIQ